MNDEKWCIKLLSLLQTRRMHPLKSSSLMFGGSNTQLFLTTSFSSSGPETTYQCMEKSILHVQLDEQYIYSYKVDSIRI